MDPFIIINGVARILPVADKMRNIKSVSEGQTPSNGCVLEEVENNNFCLKWSGTIPAKCKKRLVKFVVEPQIGVHLLMMVLGHLMGQTARWSF